MMLFDVCNHCCPDALVIFDPFDMVLVSEIKDPFQ